MKKIIFAFVLLIIVSGCGRSLTNLPDSLLYSGCQKDSDCKIIYGNCNCLSTNLKNPRETLNTGKNDVICITNSCPGKTPICKNNKCDILHFNEEPVAIINADLAAQLKSGTELNESAPVEIALPEGIEAGQIMKYFKLGDLYLALVLRPSMNVLLPDIEAGFKASFVGVLAAKANDRAWTKILQLKDSVQTDKNNPYYLWLKDNKIFLSVVDQNGAGSGEGLMKVLTLNNKNLWVIDSCYYFDGNYTDGDYFIFSQYLDKAEARPLSECSNLKWE